MTRSVRGALVAAGLGAAVLVACGDRAAPVAGPSAGPAAGRSPAAAPATFDVTRADHGDRDQGMAARIVAEADRNPEGITLALTGNFHARTDSERWMSWHIARRHPQLITLSIAHAAAAPTSA